MNITPLTTLVLFATTLYWFQNLLRYVKAKDVNGAGALILTALGGIAAVALGAHSAATSGLVLIQGGAPLGALDAGALVQLGIALGSTAPAFADVIKSIDRTRSSSKPNLFGAGDDQLPKAA